MLVNCQIQSPDQLYTPILEAEIAEERVRVYNQQKIATKICHCDSPSNQVTSRRPD